MNNRHNDAISQIYQEGIFDRLGARAKGVLNTKMFGGTGYNQGKAADFKKRLYARIAKDIDKFLNEVQTMDNMYSLDDFETKYPEIAKKIACMAAAINHPTPLRTQCPGDAEDTPPPPPPSGEKWECAPAPGGGSSCRISDTGTYNSKEECEANCSGGVTPPPPPRQKKWACRKDGTCYPRPDGKYSSKAECEAKCRSGGGGGNGNSNRRGSGGSNIIKNKTGRDNNGVMAGQSGGHHNTQNINNITRVYITNINNGVPKDKAATIALRRNGKPVNKDNKAKVIKNAERYRDPVTGRYAKKPTT